MMNYNIYDVLYSHQTMAIQAIKHFDLFKLLPMEGKKLDFIFHLQEVLNFFQEVEPQSDGATNAMALLELIAEKGDCIVPDDYRISLEENICYIISSEVNIFIETIAKGVYTPNEYLSIELYLHEECVIPHPKKKICATNVGVSQNQLKDMEGIECTTLRVYSPFEMADELIIDTDKFIFSELILDCNSEIVRLKGSNVKNISLIDVESDFVTTLEASDMDLPILRCSYSDWEDRAIELIGIKPRKIKYDSK